MADNNFNWKDIPIEYGKELDSDTYLALRRITTVHGLPYIFVPHPDNNNLLFVYDFDENGVSGSAYANIIGAMKSFNDYGLNGSQIHNLNTFILENGYVLSPDLAMSFRDFQKVWHGEDVRVGIFSRNFTSSEPLYDFIIDDVVINGSESVLYKNGDEVFRYNSQDYFFRRYENNLVIDAPVISGASNDYYMAYVYGGNAQNNQVYGATLDECLDAARKAAGPNIRKNDKCYVYKLNAETSKFDQIGHYTILEGKNITPVEIVLPQMSKTTYSLATDYLKNNHGTYHKDKNTWTVPKRYANEIQKHISAYDETKVFLSVPEMNDTDSKKVQKLLKDLHAKTYIDLQGKKSIYLLKGNIVNNEATYAELNSVINGKKSLISQLNNNVEKSTDGNNVDRSASKEKSISSKEHDKQIR